MKKIPVYFILPNLNISGVLTFCENAINHINAVSDRYEAAILYTGQEKDTGVCAVPIVRLCEGYHTTEYLIASLIKFLNSKERAVIVPNYMFSLLPAMPFLHSGIMRLFILHSDEQIYYDSARLMNSYFDSMICVSGYIRNKLTSEDPYLIHKTEVIPYGIDIPETLPKKISDGKIRVLYSGRLLEYQKRVSRLTDMALALDKATNDYKFVFVGDGSSSPMMKDMLKDQIDAGRAVFTGRVPREDINGYLAEADIFVLTSDFEGTPLALLEAMAYGCVPVVNHIESGIPEVVEEEVNGYIIPECNIDLFVERITQLKDDREQLKELSRSSFEKAVREYSTQVMGGRFLNVFDRFFDSVSGSPEPKEFSTEFFACLKPYLFEEKHITLLRFFDRVAVFGCGASGLATLEFLSEVFPGKCVLMIDDNYSGSFHGLDVVTTDVFLAERVQSVDLIVFGAYQKVNRKLLDTTKIPYIKLDNIV